MKKVILLFSVFVYQLCCAQKNETIFYTDDDGAIVKEKNASFLVEKIKLNDTLWEFNTYKIYGSLIKTYHTKDEKGAIKNGDYFSIKRGGGDTTGYFSNNKKDQEWNIYTSSNRLLKRIIYQNDVLINEKDSTQVQAEARIENAKSKDSSKDVVFKKVEIESSFPGGASAWAKYLGNNLHYPKDAIKKDIQGTVVVQFIVNKEGKVENVRVVRSLEYSLDKEAARIIRESPDWTPAVQDGRTVKSYKLQPIVFKL